jgi:hypothetical protein
MPVWTTWIALKREGPATLANELERFIRSARDALSSYGRDYAIGAVRGLAVRNMISVVLPDSAEGFYPIVKVHEMALRELEDLFYDLVQLGKNSREELILKLVDRKVWE